MPELYQATNELLSMRQAMEKDELPEEAITDTLLANAGEFEAKAVALYQAADEVDYDVQLLDTMIADLQARKELLVKRQDTMRGALLRAMVVTGITQIACPFFTLSTKATPRAVVIDDEQALPDEFVEVKVENKPNKKEIGAALRAGKDVPGAHLAPAGVTLQMRKK